ncbi:glycosyltransferase [Cellulophaga sp. Asnod2-G02]|uniref:glycosyltransferase n=1 Tax=Cellulophaga sp. Asnod2-G02 TaxID=3160572 RepID=UPI003868F685
MEKNKKNIAFLVGRVSIKGGISRVTSIITDELCKTGLYNIHVISYHPAEKGGYHWNSDIKFHNLLTARKSMKKGIIPATINLTKVIKNNKIDILVATGHIVGPLCAIAKIFTKMKLLYWSHSSFFGEKHFSKSFNEKFTSLISNEVITLTKADEVNYLKYTKAKKVENIYNPIDKNLLVKENLYDVNSKKIISVGRLTKSKQFNLLIDVAEIIFKENDEYILDIYGTGECESTLAMQIDNANLNNRIFLKGHVSDIYSKYKEYSMLVMTSEYEGFPMSLLEGMANKLPLVSFNVPTGPNEIITNNINGNLIDPFNVEDMAKSILDLINDSEKRIAYSSANENLIQEFSIENVITKWVKMLNN